MKQSLLQVGTFLEPIMASLIIKVFKLKAKHVEALVIQ
jgi:hypothetical protein